MSTQLSVNVKTDIEKELPKIIEFNFEPLKKELAATLEKYDGMVVTKEGIKDAKSTRADLNRFKKSLNDTRIAIGKEWSKPYDKFKTQVDELISMVDQPAAAIDNQIKAFDEAEREDKRAAITKFYTQNVKELQDVLPLERIWDDKWLNKTVTLNSATDQLYNHIDAVRKDLKTIDTMEIEHKDYLRSAYLRTLHLGDAMDERRKYEEEQKALKKSQEPPAPAPEPPAPMQQAAQFPPEMDTPPAPLPETSKDICLNVLGTTAAMRRDLKTVFIKYGYEYGKNYFIGGIPHGAQ
ncbi:DUF1351 domain-containing protein [Ruminococcaceae bacterium OttesenSCG-928-I18]|nr:DUF1351 domain-containing protein [Ruminococcaceae bacterium OttesenSCG-928-I18]